MKFKIGDKVKTTMEVRVAKNSIGTVQQIIQDDTRQNLCISFPKYKGKLHTGGSHSPVIGCENKDCYWIYSDVIKTAMPNWKSILAEQTDARPDEGGRK